MKFDAVIFDLDGTLVQSVHLYEEAFIHMVNSTGDQISTEKFRKLYGENMHLSSILKELQIEDSEDDLRKIRDMYYCDLLRKKVEWFPDAKNFLEVLPPTLLKAIVTGSWQSFVDAIEERVPLSQYFRIIMTADDYRPYGKPHPHSLLLTADQLEIDPEQCIYIGDQWFDIEAANAAGMTSCLIKRSFTTKDAGKEADIVVTSLEELLPHLL